MVASGVTGGFRHEEGSGAAYRIAIIADDLTGACDAAVAFASVLPEVRVALIEELPPANGLWAISTDTRDADANICEARLRTHLIQTPVDTEILKKVDSAFRGNTALEIAEAVRCFPGRLAIIAPAYPALGRTMQDAKLLVSESSQTEEVSVQARLKTLGCPTASLAANADPTVLRREIAAIRDLQTRALLCDATETVHLRAIVQAAKSQNRPNLWIGSAGLAHALAAEFPALAAREIDATSCGHCVFFIGSNHAVTRGQVLHLRRATGLPIAVCGASPKAREGSLLLSVPRGEAEANVREAVSHLNAQHVGCLFMTGGDTARLVCRALGIVAIRLHREFVPGVPVGTAEGGRFDGVPVLLKSGAFGDRNLLRDVLEVFGGRKDMACA